MIICFIARKYVVVMTEYCTVVNIVKFHEFVIGAINNDKKQKKEHVTEPVTEFACVRHLEYLLNT